MDNFFIVQEIKNKNIDEKVILKSLCFLFTALGTLLIA